MKKKKQITKRTCKCCKIKFFPANAFRNEHVPFCSTCKASGMKERLNWYRNSGAEKAHTLVRLAINTGILPALRTDIKCFDCEEQATEYDHRDYSYPLFVHPVCHSCNKKRGQAKPLAPYTPIRCPCGNR